MKKRLSNNKGFSLVELIIVIAIMAVLIGVLAPQYLKYVEKSRVSADLDTIDNLVKAAETCASDPDTKIADDFTITIVGGTAGATVGGTDTAAPTEVGNAIALSSCNLKSKTYNSQTVVISVAFTADPNNANIKVPTVSVTDPTNNYER